MHTAAWFLVLAVFGLQNYFDIFFVFMFFFFFFFFVVVVVVVVVCVCFQVPRLLIL